MDTAGFIINLEVDNRIPYITDKSKRHSPGENESDLVQALQTFSDYDHKLHKPQGIAFPTVGQDDESDTPQEEISSEEEEEPLTPAQRIDHLLTPAKKERLRHLPTGENESG